jgi:hypothetical protein
MNTCSGCRYFLGSKIARFVGTGTCHKNPPTMSGFPPVDNGDWCGEWEEAFKEAEDNGLGKTLVEVFAAEKKGKKK